MKKGVGSGSISQRYGSGDPDPHQNVTDPQHCFFNLLSFARSLSYLEKFLVAPTVTLPTVPNNFNISWKLASAKELIFLVNKNGTLACHLYGIISYTIH
jgi:hypothetical protein